MGAGIQFRFEDLMSVDMRGGLNLTFSDQVNPEQNGSNDSYLNLLVGFRVHTGKATRSP